MNTTNFLPLTQEEIDKERSIIVFVRNRHGVETLLDLYTAKKLVKSGDVEIIDKKPEKPEKPEKTTKPKADDTEGQK